MTDRITVTNTAKLIRAALRAAHPAVKFSVRSSRYAGGASIDIYWTDGPTAAQVDRTAQLYRGSTFDGMTDSKRYHTSLLADGGGVREVRFGADHVFTHRTVSDAHVAQVRADIEAQGRAARLVGYEGPCSGCIHWVRDGDAWVIISPADGDVGIGGACSVECAATVTARLTAAQVPA